MFRLKIDRSFQFEINATLLEKFEKGSTEINIVGRPMGAVIRDKVVFRQDLKDLIIII